MRFKESGDVIAQGTQQIVYMDAKTGRPMNLPEEEIARFWLENPRVFPFERFPKIAPAENACTMQRRVELMDLDAYAQVNNVIYVSYAEEAAAQDFASRGWPPARFAEANLAVVTRRIHIQYSAITGWGEILNLSTHLFDIKDTGGSRHTRMTRTGGSPVAECIIDWDLVDRTSGEARPLPAELR
jgi:acyl-CoA thioesterase FadM